MFNIQNAERQCPYHGRKAVEPQPKESKRLESRCVAKACQDGGELLQG